ncbi:MAG: hypothetical protein H6677_18600 [Candidatus Obscuribacterales bacterium]|nr:hypothetical protein [Cyanobacteria bacterium HKST-UBA01]MCB9470289.1 hypothetical protein [Candidatus Obscuribacterales bacterium]
MALIKDRKVDERFSSPIPFEIALWIYTDNAFDSDCIADDRLGLYAGLQQALSGNSDNFVTSSFLSFFDWT